MGFPHTTVIPVTTDISGWENIKIAKDDARKPFVYMRQEYAIKIAETTNVYAYFSVQRLPSFRGAELPLSEIDAAFERASQAPGDLALGGWFIQSMSNITTATGTLLGHPSREFMFQAKPGATIRYYRMMYTSFDGKLYGLEMGTLDEAIAFDDEWSTMLSAVNAESASSSSSSSPASSSSSSRSSISSSSSSTSSSPMTSLEERTCERVRRWFGDSETLRAHVNERLLKRFGFLC